MNEQLIIVILLPILFGVVGFVFYFKTQKLLKEGIITKAKVVDYVSYDKRKEGRTKTYYKPVVHYIKENGQEINFSPEIGSGKKWFEIGQDIEVVYHPRKNIQKIHSFKYLYMIPSIFFGLGGLILLIALAASYL